MDYMNPLILRPALAGLIVVILCAGCASSGASDKPASTKVRPIDKVREEIVSLQRQMVLTIAATEAVVAESGPSVRARRQNLANNLRATETQVETLRSNAKDLNERATEYLALWGGQVDYIGTSGGPQVGTNAPRQQAKATYDRMVAALLKARDVMTPLQSSLQQLEQRLTDGLSTAQIQALSPDVKKAANDGREVNSHLQESLAALDELLAQQKNAPKR